MKDAGPSPAVFGVECCQGLWGGLALGVITLLESENSGKKYLQTECLCKEMKLCGVC